MAGIKKILVGAVVVFGVIGAAGLWKKKDALPNRPLEKVVDKASFVQEVVIPSPVRSTAPKAVLVAAPSVKTSPAVAIPAPSLQEESNEADRIGQLFASDSSKLPFVETVVYSSRVPWLKGRPAWIADYASHYETSRHFIARGLNRKPDYFTQKISPGDRFNVFKKDKNLRFHLVIDLSRCKMWFYCHDADTNDRLLLKTYKVGLGRTDPKRVSGFLSPLGTYELGDKIAIYKPGTVGFFQDRKTEMIRIFGTRWIPFGKEVEGCSESSKGFGLHGAPWIGETSLSEDRSKIGTYDSDGCIRLLSEDMEELFAIVITKPTTVHLVKDFRDASLPGVEKSGVEK